MTSMALFEKGKTLLLLYLMLSCIYDRIMSSLPPLSIVLFKAARGHWAMPTICKPAPLFKVLCQPMRNLGPFRFGNNA